MEKIMQHETAPSSSRPVAGRYYCADELGAPFKVYLGKGCTVERKHGEEIVSIEDLPGLLAAVVQARVLHPRKLAGADLRFIRTVLRMKSKVLADRLGLTPEHYSRCESGEKTMAATTEKAYRLFAFLSSVARDREVQEVLNDRRELPPISPAGAKKAVEAFSKVFYDMDIEPVADAADQLSFSFSRRNCSEEPCGHDEAEWEQKAA